MIDPAHPISQLIEEDSRYKVDAYVFVFESLNYAHSVMGLGEAGDTMPDPGEEETERHVTGQELCEAIRQLALRQFGYMAKTVLNSWGICRTGDFGEIVFSMVRIGQMRKTDQDCREDFEDVFDFETAFQREFKISMSEEEEE